MMNTEVNKQLVRRFEEEAWNRKNRAILDELCAPSYTAHMPGNRSLDCAAHKQIVALFQRAFPDCEVTTEDCIADGHRVAWRWIFRGEFHGLPPTGRRVTMTGISVLRIQDHRVMESWHQGDNQSLMQQLTAA